jgi:hypothetical protein
VAVLVTVGPAAIGLLATGGVAIGVITREKVFLKSARF